MNAPKHLWSGEWRAELDARRRDPADAPLRPAADGEPEGPPGPGDADGDRPPRGRRPLNLVVLGGAALISAALIGGAFIIAADDHGSGSTALKGSAPVALPVATGKAVKPSNGTSKATAIYAAASPAVVSIRAGNASGTGFLIDKPGTIVTNAHVVDTNTRVTIKFGATGRDISGTVLGSDPSSDLAVIHISPSAVPSNAMQLELADSSTVSVGDPVIAIGNPFGLDRTETAGIVSALGRELQEPNGFEISGAIQTDAAINPGNSGGPLLDDSGHVIGVNSQIETGGSSSGNVGVGFAVPSNSLRQIVPLLEQGKTIAHPWLGVSTTGSAVSAAGAQIETVASDSPAEAAGLQQGDVVTAVGSEKVNSSDDLGRLIDRGSIGDRLTLKVLRNGSEMSVVVTLRERPTSVP